MKNKSMVGMCVALTAATVSLAAGNWLAKVPDSERNRTNPFSQQADAVAAGEKLYQLHCASCHGDDAAGKGKRPSLRSERVQSAKDGEIFWLLGNGNLWKGMPTWKAMPEPMRWQIVAYVKSLRSEANAQATKTSGGRK
jgi:mono/diheme cytochrome c family protein